MSHSDLKALAELSAPSTSGAARTEEFIYRACAAAANAGQKRPEEATLSATYLPLLEARRLIYSSNWDEAAHAIDAQEFKLPILRGDACFLRGIVSQRGRGDLKSGAEWMEKAAAIFHEDGAHYRMIRARINALIFKRDLGEYVAGELYAVEQECVRLSYFDMAASISRGRAIELAVLGDFDKALAPCETAAEYYALDGCPEDRDVCQAIRAILLHLRDRAEEAERVRRDIRLDGGRLTAYLAAIDALKNGKIPALEPNHPLARVPWNKSAHAVIKKNSNYGRILALLREGPQDKNQLIETIWGKQAGGEAYENRLRVALASLRKTYAVDVIFDGAKYRLAGQSPKAGQD